MVGYGILGGLAMHVWLESTPWPWRSLRPWSLACNACLAREYSLALEIPAPVEPCLQWPWRSPCPWSLCLACYCDDLAEVALIALVGCGIPASACPALRFGPDGKQFAQASLQMKPLRENKMDSMTSRDESDM